MTTKPRVPKGTTDAERACIQDFVNLFPDGGSVYLYLGGPVGVEPPLSDACCAYIARYATHVYDVPHIYDPESGMVRPERPVTDV